MKQIIIEVSNQEKAKLLLELLTALDFVDSVKTGDEADVQTKTPKQKQTFDFFSMAGIWQNREINSASIRQRAWPRQS